MASASPIYIIRINGKISDSPKSWGLSLQKKDQSYKDWHRISGGAPAHKAGLPPRGPYGYSDKMQYDSLPRQEGVSPLGLVALVAGDKEERMKEKEAWKGQGEM